MMARDSERLIVMDDNVKHRGLFSYYLPRIVAVLLLAGLTIYGALNVDYREKLSVYFTLKKK